MAPRADLSIAGVHLALSSRHRIDLKGLDASYDPFLDAACAFTETLDIAIRIELGSAPCMGGLATIFDSGDPWIMSTDGDSYYLTLAPPGLSGQELWTAQFARDVSQVTVYCGERMVTRTQDDLAITNPVTYPLDQILLMLFLARHEGALVHAAGVNMGGKGFIFPGKSRAGKSTLATHLAGREDIRLLSDDRMALRKICGRFVAYGTPWPGDQGAALNESAPLCGIYFLHHADADEIIPLEPRGAAERLLPVTSIPWYDPEPMTMVLRFLDDLVSQVPAFELRFKPGPGVAELLAKEAG